MSRIINSDTPSQQRAKLLKLVANAVLFAEENYQKSNELNDLLAFIVLTLMEIEKTIIKTTAPWEKRDYWVKADKFRREWGWVHETINSLLSSRNSSGWEFLPFAVESLKEKIKNIEIPRYLKEKKYWNGAYAVLMDK